MDKKKRQYGRKKVYKIKSVNFGPPGDPIRLHVEHLEKTVGKTEFSKMVKVAFAVVYVHDDDKVKERYKILALKEERLQLLDQIAKISRKLHLNEDELKKLSVDPSNIVVPAGLSLAKKTMPNTCRQCGKEIENGKGRIDSDGNKFHDGDCYFEFIEHYKE